MNIDLLDLPFPIILKIFLDLDGSSLHKCRLVCKEWNSFILREIWSSCWGKRVMREKLDRHWRNGEYRVAVTNLPVDCQLGLTEVLLCVSEDACAVRLGGSGLSVTVLQRYSGERWEAEVHEDRQEGDFFRTVIMTDLLLIGVSSLGKVVCWDRREKKRGKQVFNTSFVIEWTNLQAKANNTLMVVWSDKHQKLIGFDVSLDSEDNIEVSEVWNCAPPELGYIHLHDLSLTSHLLVENNTDDRSGLILECWSLQDKRSLQLKLEPIHLTESCNIELGVLFHPYAALSVCTNVMDNWDTGWKIQIWNVSSGTRVREFAASGYITDLKYCDSRLAVCRKVSDLPALVIYDTQDLVDTSIVEPKKTSIQIDCVTDMIHVTKTSLLQAFFDSSSVKFLCFDFWKSNYLS